MKMHQIKEYFTGGLSETLRLLAIKIFTTNLIHLSLITPEKKQFISLINSYN